ncbi:HET-domain-containing protein [Plenodomus tracheiphilus IPT5]|uniref:HET-domain-containing protein n=1 Tax=Plenodomus tracheiphilus IPT5 TaxID=1408161 RepID=A0A6A7B8T7_9PLEO|nr:HET-domain-containing protein [Plenodomus tracheiphilus IPT5]
MPDTTRSHRSRLSRILSSATKSLQPPKKTLLDYQYEPLPDPQTTIRVAALQPGAYQDVIQLSFQTRLLKPSEPQASETTILNYEALSYAWGNNDQQSHVLMDTLGKPQGTIAITRNLDVALRHLRSKSQFRSLWIDALCINQSDDVEKGMQVAIMGKIFSLASSVIAWLGPQENQSSEALRMMQFWASQIEPDWIAFIMQPSDTCTEPQWADTRVAMPYKAGELGIICNLLQRPYFERLWVRQEVALSSVGWLQCGHELIPWQDFRKAIFCLHYKDYFPTAVASDVGSDRRYNLAKNKALDLCQAQPSSTRLATMRFDMRHAQCSDKRDHLFAVLDLLDKVDRDLHIVPDYTCTPKEVFVDTARRYISTNCTLDLLETCELSSRSSNIPSWVPDWSSRLGVTHNIWSTWSASGWISAQAKFGDGDRLHVCGVKISVVDRVINYDLKEFDSSNDDKVKTLRKLRLMGQLDQSQEWEGKTGLLHRCCSTLLNDNVSESRLPPRDDVQTFAKCETVLKLLWSLSGGFKELCDYADGQTTRILGQLTTMLTGRCFIQMADGKMSLAPAGTQFGDIITVLLGCRFPVLLRRAPVGESEQSWQVVGVCQAPGLMHGEAIYGNKLPDQWQFVWRQEYAEDDLVDDYPHTLYDAETGTTRSNPAEILEEVGIKVESYQRDPHRLVVLPETLRAAGIPVEDFVLT